MANRRVRVLVRKVQSERREMCEARRVGLKIRRSGGKRTSKVMRIGSGGRILRGSGSAGGLFVSSWSSSSSSAAKMLVEENGEERRDDEDSDGLGRLVR